MHCLGLNNHLQRLAFIFFSFRITIFSFVLFIIIFFRMARTLS